MRKRTPLIELKSLFQHYPELSDCGKDIIKVFETLLECYRNKGLIMACGNGGSAADAEHIVGELMKGFKQKRPLNNEQRKCLEYNYPEDSAYLTQHLQQAIPAVSLVGQAAFSSAFANDVAGDMVFAQQVFGYGKQGDALIGISTSGNAKNVINACKTANAFSIKTIALTGWEGGILKIICDTCICVPARETYRVQEYHLPVYHTLCAMMEAEIFERDE
jgi:D-sedoheptulose 7-phosphate isomerase